MTISSLDARSFGHVLVRAVREFGGVQFSVRYDDPEELQDSVQKLRNGPILANLHS